MSNPSFLLRSQAEKLASRPLTRMGQKFFEKPYVYFRGDWAGRNELNVPGAFYGAETDTTGQGPAFAPASVALDGDGRAFVWRQPRNEQEIHALMTAASSDPFHGWAWNGDHHWTPDSFSAWWGNRERRRIAIDAVAKLMRAGSEQKADEFWSYSTSGAEHDVARYAEYLRDLRPEG